MRKLLYLISSCLVGQALLSGCDSKGSLDDPEQTHFIKFYGGDGDQTGDDFVVLPDGSFILFGTTTPSGVEKLSQWYLVKADAKGAIMWEKRFGMPALSETASDIELTTDGKLVAVGNVYLTPTNRDVKIMTFTLDGVRLDSATIPIYKSAGVDALGDEDAASVTETGDGYIIAGSTTYVFGKGSQGGAVGSSDPRDALNIRVNKDLTPYVLNGWPSTLSNGFFSDDISRKIYPASTGFYVFGFSNTPNSGHPTEEYNVWYYYLTSSGIATTNYYFGSTTENEKIGSACTAPGQSGSGFLLTGLSYNQSGTASIYSLGLRTVLAFNVQDQKFQKTFSVNLGTNQTEKTSVFASQTVGFYVLANEKSFNDNQNWILTKFDNDGLAAWTLPIVFGGEGPDTCGGIQELPDGRVVMIGTMRTGKPDAGEFKMTLIKVNADGKLLN